MKPISMFISIIALLSFFFTGSTGLRVIMDLYNHSKSDTECKVGIIEDQDQMIFTGLVYFQDTDKTIKKQLEVSAKQKGGEDFVKLCSTDFDAEGCGNDSDVTTTGRSGCYCSKRVPPLYFFAANITVGHNFSKGEIRASFGLNKKRVLQYHGAPQPLPNVYKLEPNVSLRIDGKEVALGESCLHEIGIGATTTIEFCSFGLEKPVLTIIFDASNWRNTSGKDCITETLTVKKARINRFYTFKYADGCKRADEFSCRITSTTVRRVVIDPVNWKESGTKCKKGIISGIDHLVYNGFVNVSETNIAWKKVFVVSIKEANGTKFHTQCTINVDKHGCNGTLSKKFECYCKQYTAPLYFFVVNKSAQIYYSRGQIQASWGMYHSFPQPIPLIYKAKVSASLEVDGKDVSLEKPCMVKLPPGIPAKFKVCTAGLESPTLSITLDPAVTRYSKGKDCITEMISPQKKHMDKAFVLNYSDGCQRTGSFSCMMKSDRCRFPKQLTGEWLSSTKGAITFTASNLTNFHPCLAKSKCNEHTSTNWNCVRKVNEGYFVRTGTWSEKRGNKLVQLRAHACIYLTKVTNHKFTYYMGPKERASSPYNDYVLVTPRDQYVDPTDVCNVEGSAPGSRIGVLIYKSWEWMSQSSVHCPSLIGMGVFSVDVPGPRPCRTNMKNCDGTSIHFANLPCHPFSRASDDSKMACMLSSAERGVMYTTLFQIDHFITGSQKFPFLCMALHPGSDALTIEASYGLRCDVVKETTLKMNFTLYQRAASCPKEVAVKMASKKNLPLKDANDASEARARLYYTLVIACLTLGIL